MKIIYIAGPYRGASESAVFDNIMRAREAAQRLWSLGWVVICPHLNSMFMTGQDNQFLKGDLEILSRCDAIFMLDGWKDSAGASLEYELAIEQQKTDGMEIYYEAVGYPECEVIV